MESDNWLYHLGFFYVTLVYVVLYLEATKKGRKISIPYLLFLFTAITFIISGLSIGFVTMLVYIIISVIIVAVGLPLVRIFLDKRRKH